MSDIYYLIAGGPSYLDVTEKEWDFLKNQHTMSVARVPYGGRKTEYWLSIEHKFLDSDILHYMAKLGWFDIKILLYNAESVILARKLGFKKVRKIMKENFYFQPSRRPWFEDEENPPNTYYETRAKNFHQPLFRYRGQLTAAINACMILGATEIRLIGVDMNDQGNFYDREDFKYMKLLCKDKETIDNWIKYKTSIEATDREKSKVDLNPNYKSDNMHTTDMPMYEYSKYGDRAQRGMVDLIQWTDRELREEGYVGIFITNKKSILFTKNKIEYKDIMEN